MYTKQKVYILQMYYIYSIEGDFMAKRIREQAKKVYVSRLSRTERRLEEQRKQALQTKTAMSEAEYEEKKQALEQEQKKISGMTYKQYQEHYQTLPQWMKEYFYSPQQVEQRRAEEGEKQYQELRGKIQDLRAKSEAISKQMGTATGTGWRQLYERKAKYDLQATKLGEMLPKARSGMYGLSQLTSMASYQATELHKEVSTPEKKLEAKKEVVAPKKLPIPEKTYFPKKEETIFTKIKEAFTPVTKIVGFKRDIKPEKEYEEMLPYEKKGTIVGQATTIPIKDIESIPAIDKAVEVVSTPVTDYVEGKEKQEKTTIQRGKFEEDIPYVEQLPYQQKGSRVGTVTHYTPTEIEQFPFASPEYLTDIKSKEEQVKLESEAEKISTELYKKLSLQVEKGVLTPSRATKIYEERFQKKIKPYTEQSKKDIEAYYKKIYKKTSVPRAVSTLTPIIPTAMVLGASGQLIPAVKWTTAGVFGTYSLTHRGEIGKAFIETPVATTIQTAGWIGGGMLGARIVRGPKIYYRPIKTKPRVTYVEKVKLYSPKEAKAMYRITVEKPSLKAEMITKSGDILRKLKIIKKPYPIKEFTKPQTYYVETLKPIKISGGKIIGKGWVGTIRKGTPLSMKQAFIYGEQKPFTLAEFKTLPKSTQYILQKMAEQKAGRPISLKFVPQILGKEFRYGRGPLVLEKLGKVKVEPATRGRTVTIKSGFLRIKKLPTPKPTKIKLDLAPAGKTKFYADVITKSEALKTISLQKSGVFLKTKVGKGLYLKLKSLPYSMRQKMTIPKLELKLPQKLSQKLLYGEVASKVSIKAFPRATGKVGFMEGITYVEQIVGRTKPTYTIPKGKVVPISPSITQLAQIPKTTLSPALVKTLAEVKAVSTKLIPQTPQVRLPPPPKSTIPVARVQQIPSPTLKQVQMEQLKTKIKEISKPTQKELPSLRLKSILKTIQKPQLKEIQKPQLKVIQKAMSKQVQKPQQKVIQKNIQKTIQKTIQKQILKTDMTTIPRPTFTLTPRIPTFPVIKPPVTADLKKKVKAKKRKTRYGEILTYGPTFTEKALGVEPVELTLPEVQKLLKTKFTGFEVFPAGILKL